MKKNVGIILGIAFGFIFMISSVWALPSGPTGVSILGSGRYSTSGAANISAMAGNTTEINLNGTAITQTWQGYYGNVTGTIVLGNSNNQTMYNWNLTSPSGQIYATRVASVPAWTSVRCANVTEVETEDAALGVTNGDADSANNTFTNTTTFTDFYVGSISINTTQNCRAVNLFGSTGQPSSSFAEVLLSDTTNMIYTGIITAPTLGFDSANHQFQMLVGQNGHNGGPATTPYYFYLELN